MNDRKAITFSLNVEGSISISQSKRFVLLHTTVPIFSKTHVVPQEN